MVKNFTEDSLEIFVAFCATDWVERHVSNDLSELIAFCMSLRHVDEVSNFVIKRRPLEDSDILPSMAWESIVLIYDDEVFVPSEALTEIYQDS